MAELILSHKKCVGCLTVKSVSEFSPHKNTRDKMQPKCKKCRNLVANNVSEEKKAIYYANAKKLYSAEKRREDKKKYYVKNKDAVISRACKWAKDNPAIMASRAMNRLSLQRKATPPWADIKKIEKFYEESKRLEDETGCKHHVDHVVPIKSKYVCGLHVENNLMVLTAAENIAKSNRTWPDMP